MCVNDMICVYRCNTGKEDIKPLQWDDKLEALALRAASLCHFEEYELHTDTSLSHYKPIPGTDGWRSTDAKALTGYDRVGENVFRQPKEDKAGLTERGATCVDAWMGKVKTDYGNNVCNRGKGTILDPQHTHVGCASKVCENGTLTYCEYGKEGDGPFWDPVEPSAEPYPSVSGPVCDEFRNVAGPNFIEASVIIPCILMSAVYLAM